MPNNEICLPQLNKTICIGVIILTHLAFHSLFPLIYFTNFILSFTYSFFNYLRMLFFAVSVQYSYSLIIFILINKTPFSTQKLVSLLLARKYFNTICKHYLPQTGIATNTKYYFVHKVEIVINSSSSLLMKHYISFNKKGFQSF